MFSAMDQEVSHQPETAETWVRSQASPCEICGGKCGTGFSPSTVGFPLSATFHQWSTLILILYVLPKRRSNRQSLGTFHKAILVHIRGGTGLLLVSLHC